MQQEIIVNRIIKLIEEKQNNGEFGTIRIEFRAGVIVDVNENRTRKIKVKKEADWINRNHTRLFSSIWNSNSLKAALHK